MLNPLSLPFPDTNRNTSLVRRLPEDEGVLLLSLQPFTQEERTLVDGESTADFTHSVKLSTTTLSLT